MIKKRKKSSLSSYPTWLGWLCVACVTLVVMAGMVSFELYKLASQPAKPASLIERVGRHIIINATEQPAIATVQNPDNLRKQNPLFYKDAQVGDRLFVWSDKAVLYSESRDIILAVLPVAFTGSTTTQSQATPTATEKQQELAKIEIWNGTRTSGLGSKLAEKLKTGSYSVLKPSDAPEKGQLQTSIFYTTSSALQAAEYSATILGISTSNVLLLNESQYQGRSIQGEVLIVIGADYNP